MPWTVEVTEEFERWWDRVTEDERVSVDGMIRVLEEQGPSVGPPYNEQLVQVESAALYQLRVPHRPKAICVLYGLDEVRTTVVLLVGSVEGTDDEVCRPEDIDAAKTIYRKYLARKS